jgi:quinol monooxygenase YgiN
LATSIFKIKVKAGREAEFESIVATLTAASNANEPGIQFYRGFRAATPSEYWMVESFVDPAAAQAHLTSAHLLAHRPKLVDCIDGPPEAHQLTEI